jgi:DNA-binding MarR family transcriptional regulator
MTQDQQPVTPLTQQEEAVWRALSRAVLVLPRALDADLLGSQGLNLNEYSVLMNLSEAPGRSMRMSELADYVSISVSGLTRVVERLSHHGLVERAKTPSDGRGQVAVLTPAGLDRLQQAWPAHLASVRRHVMDHLDGIDLTALARALSAMAATEVGPPARRRQPAAAASGARSTAATVP